MSVISGPASIGSLGVKNPEIGKFVSSVRSGECCWRRCSAISFSTPAGRPSALRSPGIQDGNSASARKPWAGPARPCSGATPSARRSMANLSDKFGGRRVMSAGAILSVNLELGH